MSDTIIIIIITKNGIIVIVEIVVDRDTDTNNYIWNLHCFSFIYGPHFQQDNYDKQLLLDKLHLHFLNQLRVVERNNFYYII